MPNGLNPFESTKQVQTREKEPQSWEKTLRSEGANRNKPSPNPSPKDARKNEMAELQNKRQKNKKIVSDANNELNALRKYRSREDINQVVQEINSELAGVDSTFAKMVINPNNILIIKMMPK